MLPISELVRIARTLRDDGSSAVAEAAGAPYGLTRTRFVRSSASHVFLAGRGATALDAVLRLHPEGEGYAAEVMPRVPGAAQELEDLTRDQVARWGCCLADFHRGTPDANDPDWFTDRLVPAAEALDLPRLHAVVARLDRLPRGRTTWGRTHGDPEPDNVVWSDPVTPVLVDFDDVATGWFGADVCFALRDLDPDDALVGVFLEGYAAVRDLLPEAWADFRLAHEGVTAARLVPVVAEPADPGWPEWAQVLHARVSEMQHTLCVQLS